MGLAGRRIASPWRRCVPAALLTLTCLAYAASARAADTLVFTADHWCPHTCDPRTGRSGYMIDIAREALALSGLKLQYQTKPWAVGMAEIRAGLTDAVVGTLPAEAPDLPRNTQPLGRQSNAFAVRADDSFTFEGLDSLGGRRVGTVRDYSYSPVIDSWLVDHSAQVSPLAGNWAAETNLDRLLSHEIDVVLDDEAVLRDALVRTGLTGKVRIAGRIAGGTLHVSFSLARQRSKSLIEALDNGILVLRQSGRLAEIMAGYGLVTQDP